MDLDTALNDKAPHGQRATDLLRADHEEISALFEEYQLAMDQESPMRESLAQTICMQLELHNRIEAEIFYPVVRGEDPDLVDESIQDLEEIGALVEALRDASIEDEHFDTHMLDLMDLVETHAAAEEEELFPDLESNLDETLRHLCVEIIRYKEKLVGSTEDLAGRS